MKLSRLDSTTQSTPHEAADRHRAISDEAILRVNAIEHLEGDRQRSLQQEINEIEPNAIGAFHGSEHILEDVRQLAAELTALGKEVDHLMKPATPSLRFHAIDDEA